MSGGETSRIWGSRRYKDRGTDPGGNAGAFDAYRLSPEEADRVRLHNVRVLAEAGVRDPTRVAGLLGLRVRGHRGGPPPPLDAEAAEELMRRAGVEPVHESPEELLRRARQRRIVSRP